jgi:protein-disulfide isomerase
MRHAWDRYRLLVHTNVNGPTRGDMLDDLGEGGERPIREVVITVYVDLYCERCDTEIAALEPDDVALADVVSVIAAHEPACVAAPSWPGDDA